MKHYPFSKDNDINDTQNESLNELSYEEIHERIELFNSIRNEGKLIHPHKLEFKDFKAIKIVPRTIEFIITGQCNMKCRYCLTRDRYISPEGTFDVMGEEIAIKAVDFIKSYHDNGPLLIKFFGGEPLLGVNIIHKVINALKESEIESDKMIATNGLLLDEEIIDFLADNSFLVFISLDGPPEIHDAYRKDKNGQGTYYRVLEKLQLIRTRQPEFFKSNVAINLVVAPEFSGRYSEQVRHLTNLGILYSQIHPSDTGPTSDECTHYTDAQALKVRQEKSRIRKEMLEECLSNADWEPKKSHQSYCHTHLEAMKMNKDNYQHDINGTETGIVKLMDCQTGSWNVLTIWPDGKVSACIEFKREENLVFGDLNTGYFDLEKISAFISKFRESVVEGRCAACWAVRFCVYTGCYKHFANNFCRLDWQHPIMCDAIKDDVQDRLEDFLRFKIML